jgi:hypothetical protein
MNAPTTKSIGGVGPGSGLALFAALLLTGCGQDLGPDTANLVSRPACHLDGTTGEVAAVLRNDGDGWYAIDDDTHSPLNVRSVETTDGAIAVVFSFKAGHIQTFIATPDEALARSSYFIGSSVGVDRANIGLANGGRTLNPKGSSTAQHPWSNIWIYGRFSGAVCPA